MTNYYPLTTPPDEIYHHGVLGMKWGVRRFQNKDGSLTSAGKKRYKSLEKDIRSFDSIKDGIVNKKGRTILSKKDVEDSVDALYRERNRRVSKDINKEYKKVQSLEKDIRSFDSIKDGIVNKKGKVILSKKDVEKSVEALVKEQSKHLDNIKDYVDYISDNSTVRYNDKTNKYEVLFNGSRDTSGRTVGDHVRKQQERFKVPTAQDYQKKNSKSNI